jgi:hypothetical protein
VLNGTPSELARISSFAFSSEDILALIRLFVGGKIIPLVSSDFFGLIRLSNESP